MNKSLSLIFLILIAIEIFYVSSLSFSGGSGGFSITPTIYHAVVFFLFTFFALKSTNKIIIPILIAIFYAILDEVHQIFVPGRSPSIGDVLIDSVGIFAAVIVYWLAFRKKLNSL